ncbi:MAG: septum formation protein Maf [Planctomycetes bacterium RBG_16_55_9]|nr:MAG: septum formation protein Maf [Planctomycetes bacterium RBG_16_55_9]
MTVDKHQPPIILASSSPRRRQLLSEAGYKFTVVEPDVDESAFPTERIAASEYAKTLALAKAKNVAAAHPEALIIGADTVVDSAGEIIGKPTDAKNAERITRKLFGAPHKVITAIAIVRLCDRTQIVQSDSTTVYPKPMTDGQIEEHIKSGTWRGKAGAYAIQETGDKFVDKIDGSLTNVMGLPMELLKILLTGRSPKNP